MVRIFIVKLQRKSKTEQLTYIQVLLLEKKTVRLVDPELSANILFLADKKVPVCMFFGTFVHH